MWGLTFAMSVGPTKFPDSKPDTLQSRPSKSISAPYNGVEALSKPICKDLDEGCAIFKLL